MAEQSSNQYPHLISFHSASGFGVLLTHLKSVMGGHWCCWLHSWNSKLFPKQLRPPLAGLDRARESLSDWDLWPCWETSTHSRLSL